MALVKSLEKIFDFLNENKGQQISPNQIVKNTGFNYACVNQSLKLLEKFGLLAMASNDKITLVWLKK